MRWIFILLLISQAEAETWNNFQVKIQPPADETLFKEAQESFLQSEQPPLSAFKTDVVLRGECISRLDPEKKISASSSVLVDGDTILGRKVYLIPRFHTRPEMADRDLQKIHASDRTQLNLVTMLRPLQHGRYSEMTIMSLSNALLFSSRNATNPVTLAAYPSPQHFMVRSERPNFFRTIFGQRIGNLWVAQLCAERGGCLCPIGKCLGYAPQAVPVLICRFDMTEAKELVSR